VRVFACVCVHVCAFMCVHVCGHVCVCMCMHVPMFACVHVCACVCVHVCACTLTLGGAGPSHGGPLSLPLGLGEAEQNPVDVLADGPEQLHRRRQLLVPLVLDAHTHLDLPLQRHATISLPCRLPGLRCCRDHDWTPAGHST